jgi:hypothetical protein
MSNRALRNENGPPGGDPIPSDYSAEGAHSPAPYSLPPTTNTTTSAKPRAPSGAGSLPRTRARYAASSWSQTTARPTAVSGLCAAARAVQETLSIIRPVYTSGILIVMTSGLRGRDEEPAQACGRRRPRRRDVHPEDVVGDVGRPSARRRARRSPNAPVTRLTVAGFSLPLGQSRPQGACWRAVTCPGVGGRRAQVFADRDGDPARD